METFDEERQVSRPAADVEDVVTRLDARLIDELPVRCLTASQLGEHVVQGKQPVVTSCRNVRPRSFGRPTAHGCLLARNHADATSSYPRPANSTKQNPWPNGSLIVAIRPQGYP